MVGHGQFTSELGRHLRKSVGKIDDTFLVCNDHGKEDDVLGKKIVGYIHEKERSRRAKTMSHVDVAVFKDRKAIILCEIEESGANPKLIIGDVCNLLLSDEIVHNNIPYQMDGAVIVLGLVADVKGGRRKKAGLIKQRIEDYVKSERWRGMTIQLVFGKDPEELRYNTEKWIVEYLWKNRQIL
jgi:hypothetical protein